MYNNSTCSSLMSLVKLVEEELPKSHKFTTNLDEVKEAEAMKKGNKVI